MRIAGIRPSPVTRAAVVIALMAVLGGLTRMLVSGWAARDLWGFVPAGPTCLDRGTCTWEQIDARRDAAWDALVPGVVLVVLGLLLGTALALLLVPTRRRLRGRRPVTWPRVATASAAATLAVGLLFTGPVLAGWAVGPPLGFALAGWGIGALVLVLVLVGRALAPVQEAVLSALHAAFVTVVVTAACLRLGTAGEASYAVLATLLVTVPPALTGVACALGLRALARWRRRRVARRTRTRPRTVGSGAS